MNWTLEVIVVPVADIDRAKGFYAEKLGFNVDHDTQVGPDYPIVTIALARVWLKEHVGPLQQLGIATCLCGVVAISAGGLSG